MLKYKNKFVYKIVHIREWESAIQTGFFEGTDVDRRDKFIHFSSKHQVKETLKLHYLGIKNLLLVKFYSKDLNIKWEKSRNNNYFPHLYEKLNTNKAVSIIKLNLDDKGYHLLPSLN